MKVPSDSDRNKLVQMIMTAFLLWLTTLPSSSSSSSTLQTIHPDCIGMCGNVSIPYPFGTTDACFLNPYFKVTCNETFDPPVLFLQDGNVNVTNIYMNGRLEILQFVAHACYSKSGVATETTKALLSMGDFRISDETNKFTAIGCDTYAFVQGYTGNISYTTGCMAICDRIDYVVNGSCSGIGCCETPIPSGLQNITVSVSSFYNHTSVWGFNPCSYAFVIKEDEFNFSAGYLESMENIEKVPMMIEWAIGNETCIQANTSGETYVCKENSECYDAYNGSGYLCKCKAGYNGNPYIHNGCQDINECEDSDLNKCRYGCVNTAGNYTCPCPKGRYGDAREGGGGCYASQTLVIKLTVGICSGLVVLIVGVGWLYLITKNRKLIKLKERYFKQNGGLMLQRRLSGREGSKDAAKIFTAEELKKATNNYDESRIVGTGGFGTVYKGTLHDNTTVAIKKSKIVDINQTEQFINEVLVLSQINHRNVVRLLGCCLDTEVPLLVYEFVSNGTLFDHIHNKSKASALTWDIRLRIAAEIAGVLSYMHSSASTSIIHRDVKSTNILLEENYMAKVSDFGTSRLVPQDQTELSTMVQGTLGYLDPEYMLTSQLTEKSDVYSFGVLLVELLTGKKALSFDRPENERSLAMHFLLAMKEDRLFQNLDFCIVNEGSTEQLNEIGNLVKRCLQVKGEDRPTMRDVAMELEGIRMMTRHPWIKVDVNSESESAYLLGETSIPVNHVSSFNVTAAYDSMAAQVYAVGDGR